jgi:hypothetical protein
MTALDWGTTTTTTHVDVVCPPAADAVCRHCSRALAQHASTTGPRDMPTPDTAVCLDQLEFAERKAIRWLSFELADGERLDCPNVGIDPVCDVALCSDHSPEFVTCVGNSAVLHHWECRTGCPDCLGAAADDARSRA